MESIANIILCFMFYSFLGWVFEVIGCSLMQRKLVERGFLFGPVCPVYGFGGLLIVFSTVGVSDSVGLTFLISMLVCSILEYITGALLETLFKIKWWDYSTTDKYHIKGRVCLRNALSFGVCGCIVVFYLQPIVEQIIGSLPNTWAVSLAILPSALMLIDCILSSYAAKQAGKTLNLKTITGDQTNEVKKACRAVFARIRSKLQIQKTEERLQNSQEKQKLHLQKIQEARGRFRKRLRKRLKKLTRKQKKLQKRLNKWNKSHNKWQKQLQKWNKK